MSDALDPAPSISVLHEWIEHWQERLPDITRTTRVAWRRDGLGALHSRLEELKIWDAQLTDLETDARRQYGHCVVWEMLMAQQVDDIISPSIESRAAMMVNRGMASEERWLAHRTRAAVPWSSQRALERLRVLLEQAIETIRSQAWNVRDERNDIRSQIRAINVGIEIGEI